MNELLENAKSRQEIAGKCEVGEGKAINDAGMAKSDANLFRKDQKSDEALKKVCQEAFSHL